MFGNDRRPQSSGGRMPVGLPRIRTNNIRQTFALEVAPCQNGHAMIAGEGKITCRLVQ